MFLERLTIRSFRRVKELEMSFEPGRTVLPAKHAETVLRAIGILTKNEALSGPRAAWKLGKRAELRLTLRLEDGLYRIRCRRNPETERIEWKVIDEAGSPVDPKRFFARIHEAPAEARARCFDPEESYEELLRGLLEPERSYTPKAFFRMTEGIGTTRLFRTKLRELRNKGPSGAQDTCAAERNFELFLRLNALWDEIEAVRDLHHERGPIFLRGVEGFAAAGRQVIICDRKDRQIDGQKQEERERLK